MVFFGGVTPIFNVGDVKRAVRYYTEILGFKIEWEYPSIVAVSHGKCDLFLCEGDQGHPGTWVWVGLDDVDALHAEYVARGAMIRQGPTNFPWAREIQVEDPDGNVIRFGSDSKGEPYGPWKDMHGRLWPR